MLYSMPEKIGEYYYFMGPDSAPFERKEDVLVVARVYYENGKIIERVDHDVCLSVNNTFIDRERGIRFKDDSDFSYVFYMEKYQTPGRAMMIEYRNPRDISVLKGSISDPEFANAYCESLIRYMDEDPFGQEVIDYIKKQHPELELPATSGT